MLWSALPSDLSPGRTGLLLLLPDGLLVQAQYDVKVVIWFLGLKGTWTE